MWRGAIFLVTAAVLAGGCNSAKVDGPAMPAKSGEPSYLALGDSYTIGESVGETERFPVQLAGLMGWQPPKIVARTGWTGGELLAGMDTTTFNEGGYDWVTLLIGVNNQYRNWPIEDFRSEFRELLVRGLKLARGRADRLVVVSIPDWGQTPFGKGSGRTDVGKEIDAFNALCAAEAKEKSVRFVDITAISRQVPADPSLAAGDGLHPSGKQYGLWAGQIKHAISASK